MPPGFPQEGKLVELKRALYGLRDSPQLWFKELPSTLRNIGLEASLEEPCFFYTMNRKVFIIFFVDDIIIAYHESDRAPYEEIVSSLEAKCELHEGGEAEWFLGIKIVRERTEHKIYLLHDSFCDSRGRPITLEEGPKSSGLSKVDGAHKLKRQVKKAMRSSTLKA